MKKIRKITNSGHKISELIKGMTGRSWNDRKVSGSKEKIARKEKITPYLRLECIFKTRALQLQINTSLICQLVVLRMLEPRLWYHPVTPRSGGYGDVTATYIRRLEIPSRINAKHHYMQELECGSTMIIYISAEITQVYGYHREWYNIIGILHHQKYKSTSYEEIYKSWEVLTSSKRGLENQAGEERGEKGAVMI